MAKKFQKLDRNEIRSLKPGGKIQEHGITAEKMADGDVRYTVNVMVDGERFHRVVGLDSDGTKRSTCEQFISNLRSDSQEVRLSLPKKRKAHLTFGKAAEVFLSKLLETDGKDYVNNEQHIRLHLKPYFGSMRIDRLSEFTVMKYRKFCRDAGLSDATINRTLATYRRMGRYLARQGDIPNHFPMPPLAKEQNTRDYVLTPSDDVTLFAAALEDPSTYIWLFIKIGLATSLRHSEIVSLRFDRFIPETRRFKVRVKGGRWREQPLLSGVTEILLNERAMAADPNGWVFPSKRSASGHIETLGKPFARCVKMAGLDPAVVVPHTMRHTALTRFSDAGASLKSLQAFGGHLSMEMLMRYLHPQNRAIDETLAVMEKEMLNAMEGGTVIEHDFPKTADMITP